MTETEQKPNSLEHVKIKGPGKWNVIMLNDDVTPMDFVISVLTGIFKRTNDEATEVMLHVHEKGRGVAGTYMYEVAEQKMTETVNNARINGFPLNATIEEVE